MITLLLIAMIAEAERPAMRLCYGPPGAMQKDCATLADADITTLPVHSGQAFVLMRPAVHALRFGISGATGNVTSWPAEVIIDRSEVATTVGVIVTDRAGVKRWSVAIPSRELAQVRSIETPAGNYRVALHAAHYRDAALDLPAQSNVRTTVVLRHLPAITGRVVAPSGQPIASASVHPLSGCLTEFDGSFHCEVDGDWPQSISIAYPQMAVRRIALNEHERDMNLGEIKLSRGAQLVVHVHPPAVVRTATLQLFQDEEGRPPTEVARRTLTLPASEGVAIANLDPGIYRIVVKGARPFQQRAASVDIKEGEVRQTIDIEESELTLRVLSGSRPDAGASVVLKSLDGRWSGSAQTDESGAIVEPLWQLGTFTAAVRTKDSASPFFDHNELSAGEKQQWTFHIPIARIEGRVADAAGSAIAGAEVRLTTDDGDTTTSLHTKSDSNGKYAFDAVRPGGQSVAAAADGYMPSDPTEFRFLPEDTEKAVNFSLRRGLSKTVEVVDARGLPLSDAAIFETVGDRLINVFTSEAAGRAEVQLPPSDSAVLIVVPGSGSFAVHRVTAVDRDSALIRITVPDPAATLALKTETTEHQPVSEVHFLLRFDGESIPFDVLMQLAQRFRVDFHTGPSGTSKISNLPIGLYEFWPFVNVADARMLMSGSDVPAPLRIAIVPGQNEATLTFRAPHP